MLILLLLLSSNTQLDLPPALRRMIESAVADPWKNDATPKGFRIIALSHLADGCAAAGQTPAYREAAKRCVVQTYRRALALTPRLNAEAHDDQGVLRTHLNLILGAADRLGECLDPQRHQALSQALASRSLSDPLGIHPSYPNDSHRWPADQQALLASLHRHDRAHGTALMKAPLERWRASEPHYKTESGLPWSEITSASKTSKIPRGCALSWSIRYQAEWDLTGAQTLWKIYVKERYVSTAGLHGFREWPAGVDTTADVDSGPILFGVGSAATAFGLSAAQAVGDQQVANELRATATFFEKMSKNVPGIGASAETLLAQAIRFEGSENTGGRSGVGKNAAGSGDPR